MIRKGALKIHIVIYWKEGTNFIPFVVVMILYALVRCALRRLAPPFRLLFAWQMAVIAVRPGSFMMVLK